MLSEEIKKLREGRFTASMAPAVMAGDQEMMMEHYLRAIGEAPEPVQNWPMKLGSYLESFILDHHQEKIGEPLIERGTFVPHPDRPLVSATLDCYRASDDCVIDAKVCGNHPGQTIDDIIKFYTAQIVVQQRCRGAARGALLIMYGTAEPREYAVEFDQAYEAELWTRIAAFQLCCHTWTPPSPMPAVVPPEKWRHVELAEEYRLEWPNWGNEMVEHLKTWQSSWRMAAAHAEAVKKAKLLLPDDVGRVEFENVLMLRNKVGAVTIKETK